MEAIFTVVGKVAVMLILIALGGVMTKRKMLTEKGAAEMTTLLIKIVTPCLIVNSFIGSDSDLEPMELLTAVGVSTVAILIALGISYVFFRKEVPERKKVLRFAAIYSNAGFMGLPLIQAIVGGKGVIYGSFFIVVFNVICWTHGYHMMSGGKLKLKAAVLNPGIIGLLFGLPIYFFKLHLPTLITEPVGFLAGLNTPLSMIVIGSYVAQVDLRSFVSDLSVYKMAFLRLVAAPGLYLLALMALRPFLQINPELFVSSVIQAAAPVAANTVLFAVEYGCDSQLASKTVAVSTVLSIITIPLFTILAQMVCTL